MAWLHAQDPRIAGVPRVAHAGRCPCAVWPRHRTSRRNGLEKLRWRWRSRPDERNVRRATPGAEVASRTGGGDAARERGASDGGGPDQPKTASFQFGVRSVASVVGSSWPDPVRRKRRAGLDEPRTTRRRRQGVVDGVPEEYARALLVISQRARVSTRRHPRVAPRRPTRVRSDPTVAYKRHLNPSNAARAGPRTKGGGPKRPRSRPKEIAACRTFVDRFGAKVSKASGPQHGEAHRPPRVRWGREQRGIGRCRCVPSSATPGRTVSEDHARARDGGPPAVRERRIRPRPASDAGARYQRAGKTRLLRILRRARPPKIRIFDFGHKSRSVLRPGHDNLRIDESPLEGNIRAEVAAGHRLTETQLSGTAGMMRGSV